MLEYRTGVYKRTPSTGVKAPTETRTRVSGFKVLSDNRYTIRAIILLIYTTLFYSYHFILFILYFII